MIVKLLSLLFSAFRGKSAVDNGCKIVRWFILLIYVLVILCGVLLLLSDGLGVHHIVDLVSVLDKFVHGKIDDAIPRLNLVEIE